MKIISLVVLLISFTIKTYAGPIKVDLDIEVESKTTKTEKTIKDKITKPNGEIIERTTTIKTKEKTKKTKAKVKGELDVGNKNADINIKGDIFGSQKTELLVSQDGLSINRDFGELFFDSTFEVDLTISNGIITSFFLTGATTTLPSFEIPELNFSSGIATFGLIDLDFTTNILFDVLPNLQFGEFIDFDIETDVVLQFENFDEPVVFVESSSNRAFLVSEPPVVFLSIFLGLIIPLCRRRHKSH